MSDEEFHPLGNEQYKTCPHAWVQQSRNQATCSVCGEKTLISVTLSPDEVLAARKAIEESISRACMAVTNGQEIGIPRRFHRRD